MKSQIRSYKMFKVFSSISLLLAHGFGYISNRIITIPIITSIFVMLFVYYAAKYHEYKQKPDTNKSRKRFLFETITLFFGTIYLVVMEFIFIRNNRVINVFYIASIVLFAVPTLSGYIKNKA